MWNVIIFQQNAKTNVVKNKNYIKPTISSAFKTTNGKKVQQKGGVQNGKKFAWGIEKYQKDMDRRVIIRGHIFHRNQGTMLYIKMYNFNCFY